jgi:hypothetical protein
MNMENILEQIKTTADRDTLLEEIDILLSSLYENGGNAFDSVMNAKVRAWAANAISNEITNSGVEKQECLKKIRAEVEKMDTVTMILAYDPPYSSIEVISLFIKKKFGQALLVNFKYDPEIIAGCKIIYGGKYKDLSVVEKFNQTLSSLQNNKAL